MTDLEFEIAYQEALQDRGEKDRTTELIVKKMRNELTDAEAQELEKWANDNPCNQSFLDSWNDADIIKDRLRRMLQPTTPHGFARAMKLAFNTQTITLTYHTALSNEEFTKIMEAVTSMTTVVAGEGEDQVKFNEGYIDKIKKSTKVLLNELGQLIVEFSDPIALTMIAMAAAKVIHKQPDGAEAPETSND